MLKQRIITAFVLIVLFSGILFFAPPYIFSIFLGVVLLFGSWEWARLCHVESMLSRCIYACVVISIGLVCWWFIQEGTIAFLTTKAVLTCACLWWAIALLWVQGYPSSAVLWQSMWVRMIMGLLVLLPAWLAMVTLRTMMSGEYLVLAVVLVVATADIGAYFSGKAFGKRKLAPNVSPGKSWEGVAGGFFAVLIVSVAFSVISKRADLLTVLMITLPASLVSVLGDLLESMLKRHRGIKDSSQLLPGHGGILDRVDGLVAAAPLFALLVLSTGWQW